MKLPEKWSDVTLEAFVEISLIDKGIGTHNYNSETLAILTDEPLDTIEDLEIEQLNAYVKELKWATSQPHARYRHTLLGMNIKPFSKLTLFDYIDLDHYFTDNYIGNLPKICAILYRATKKNEWGVDETEPYDYDIEARAELFLDLPITDMYGIVAEFLKFREKFLDNYKNLFGEPDANEDLTDLDPDELKEVEHEQRSAKWSWEYTIFNLTNGDITKSEAVGKLPLVYVFNILAMKKELDI